MSQDAREPVTLVFKADFGADPLWRRTPAHAAGVVDLNVDLDRLPLSEELKSDVRAWARRHDEMQDPPNPLRGSEEELNAWVAAGRDLVLRLRTELGPGVEVVDGYQPHEP
ncbi:hypothetical protein [Kineococcus sp. SYSU DK005]|uniref:hypothetical protein n=1 Tax=Kineococcus sp. SYSU DK005 TaxID=3383126 RepID=UPI003D7EF9A3